MMNKKISYHVLSYNWMRSMEKEKLAIPLAIPFMNSFYSVGIRDLPAFAID